MTDTPTAAAVVVAPVPARTAMRDWINVLPVLGMIFAGGQFYSRQAETDRSVAQMKVENDRRFVQVEARIDRSDSTSVELVRKVERLDGKVDLLIERTPARP